MKRYHKKVYFPHEKELILFNNNLNNISFKYSKHCLENLKYRLIDIEKALIFISKLELDYNNIFEYYILDNQIIKVCYRIKYNDELDLILVLSNEKNIITIYINSSIDKHETLNKNLYCQY